MWARHAKASTGKQTRCTPSERMTQPAAGRSVPYCTSASHVTYWLHCVMRHMSHHHVMWRHPGPVDWMIAEWRLADTGHWSHVRDRTGRDEWLCITAPLKLRSYMLLYVGFPLKNYNKNANKKPSCRWDSRPYCFTAPSWRHRSRDHSIAHMPFPIGGHLLPKPLSLTVSDRDIQGKM